MGEENQQGQQAPAAVGVSVGPDTDVAALSEEQKGWIIRAADKIEEAEQAAAKKAADEQAEKEQYDQSRAARRARQAAAQAK